VKHLVQKERTVKIAIVTGSTRPGRNNEAVARWVFELARKRTDAEFELVDIQDYDLPLLDEPVPASLGQYSRAHTKAWSAKIAPFDAYVFVTPEYNHGTSAALKNAIDYLYREWNNKAAGFVSYGGVGGARAVEHLRLILANVMVARDCAGDAVTDYGLRKLQHVPARPSTQAGTAYDARSGHRLGRSTAIAPTGRG
jgi:NAD(P)H-dependent FMN reductase